MAKFLFLTQVFTLIVMSTSSASAFLLLFKRSPRGLSCQLQERLGDNENIVELLLDGEVVYAHPAPGLYTSRTLTQCQNIVAQANLLGAGVKLNVPALEQGIDFRDFVSVDAQITSDIEVPEGKLSCREQERLGDTENIVELLLDGEVVYAHPAPDLYTSRTLAQCQNTVARASFLNKGVTLKVSSLKHGDSFQDFVSVTE